MYIDVVPLPGHPGWRNVVLVVNPVDQRHLATCETASAWQLAVECIADAHAEGTTLRLGPQGS